MTPTRLAFAATLAAALLAAAPARAGDGEPAFLERARTALAELRFDDAKHALEKALVSGKSDPETLAGVYLLLGQVHAALGNRAEAQTAYRKLLALDPGASLARDVSPKLAKPLIAAQDAMRGRGRLAVDCQVADDRSAVILRVENDPLDMVAGARALHRASAGEPVAAAESGGTSPYTIALPERDEQEVVCAAIDPYGNQVAVVGSWDRPLRVRRVRAPTPPPQEPTGAPVRVGDDRPRRSRPLYARWYPWGGATLVASGVTGYFALATRADRRELDDLIAGSSQHDFTEARDLARRGERHALYANIALAVAAGCAALTLVTLILDPGEPTSTTGDRTSASSPPTIAPAVFDGGAGVWLRTTF